MDEKRRNTLRIFVAAASAAAGWGAGKPALAATPECVDGDEPTPRQTAGPFFLPDSPQRASLREPGEPGEPLLLRGRVLTQKCRPVPGALIDLWHADASGRYDVGGYRYRGHQFADADGRFAFATIIPGLYPGRTRHFHIRIQAPNGPVLTTQLYFPGESQNQRDFLFQPDLLMQVGKADAGLVAAFDFVVRTA